LLKLKKGGRVIHFVDLVGHSCDSLMFFVNAVGLPACKPFETVEQKVEGPLHLCWEPGNEISAVDISSLGLGNMVQYGPIPDKNTIASTLQKKIQSRPSKNQFWECISSS